MKRTRRTVANFFLWCQGKAREQVPFFFSPFRFHREFRRPTLRSFFFVSKPLRFSAKTASNPVPPLNSDFVITPTPILTPWQNFASAVEGSCISVGTSVTRLTYGPCVYRASHWHNFAWEVLTPVSPKNSLTTVMQEPLNYGGLSRTDIVAPGQPIVFPAGCAVRFLCIYLFIF